MVPSQPPALAVNALTKRFGARVAVRSIEFSLGRGSCLALFGPNGAGKTTLLRLLAGLLRPNAGHVRIGGVDVRAGTAARARVGLISHQSMLYAPLTARENVEFFASLYGLPDPPRAALNALDTMGVVDRADVGVRTLSRGLQQRVSIARAMVHAPQVVLLDEPYTGLDEAGAAALTDALHLLKREGAALILVTHHLGEGLALATHTAIMRDGQFVELAERGDIALDTYRDVYRQAVLG